MPIQLVNKNQESMSLAHQTKIVAVYNILSVSCYPGWISKRVLAVGSNADGESKHTDVAPRRI